ncbi:MAG: hypothetical protein B7Y40_04415 [Gammaproteobacteria bacterium 28-57-27]|nr:MAG: hypothetical protein B7Y40_04415 [Gammaproteobacteria bacterium 28-57-27]
MKAELTLFVPGLCAPWRGEEPHSSLPAPHVPALQGLLTRADRAAQSALAFEDALARALSQTLGVEAEDLPWGALGLWGEHGVRPDGLVLRLDPVHLKLGMTDALVMGGTSLHLSLDEANTLAQALEQHFSARGWRIVVAVPERWYVCLDEQPTDKPFELHTTPLSQALGRDAGVFKPQGKDARRWLADLTEAQMLLFAHPVNAAREARGLPIINSLWPWGAGSVAALDVPPPPSRGRAGERGRQYAPQAPCCNAPPPLPQPLSRNGRGEFSPTQFTAVYANHPLARGLALAAGLPVHDLPETFDECADMQGKALIILEDLVQPWQDSDYDDWQATLEGLEARWFAPLRRALAQGRISTLQMDTGAARFSCKPTQRWRIWRRAKNLENLCAPSV